MTPSRGNRTALALLLLCGAAGCASGGGTLGSPTGVAADSARSAAVPELDPGGAYRAAGMLVRQSPLSFIGKVSFLGTDSADSTLVLVTIALANRSLEFRPDGGLQRAGYTVSLDFIREGGDSTSDSPSDSKDDSTVVSVDSRESVRVAVPRETTASELDIIFQRFMKVPPGAYTMSLNVNDDHAPTAGSLRAPVVVPRLGAQSISSIVSVFDATPRVDVDSMPALIANPSATVVFGRDTAAVVYLEGYALPVDDRLSFVVLDDEKQPVLRDSVDLEKRRPLAGVVRRLPLSRLGPGRFTVVASLAGSADTVSAPLFVSFGEGMGIMSFDEMLSRLRYFAAPEQLRSLAGAAPAERAAVWAEFWKETDPVRSTTEHEGLREYFGRIESANRRFGSEGGEGWLTDRGKVYVALGEPDRVLMDDDRGAGVRATTQIWEYDDYGVRLVFVSDLAFERWRLTSGSELDFEGALKRARLH